MLYISNGIILDDISSNIGYNIPYIGIGMKLSITPSNGIGIGTKIKADGYRYRYNDIGQTLTQ